MIWVVATGTGVTVVTDADDNSVSVVTNKTVKQTTEEN